MMFYLAFHCSIVLYHVLSEHVIRGQTAYLPSYPGYSQEPNWFFSGPPGNFQGNLDRYETPLICLLEASAGSIVWWISDVLLYPRGMSKWYGDWWESYNIALIDRGNGSLTHLPLDKMAAISQMIFSYAFLWMIIFVFWLEFHSNFFPRVQLTITQHWVR